METRRSSAPSLGPPGETRDSQVASRTLAWRLGNNRHQSPQALRYLLLFNTNYTMDPKKKMAWSLSQEAAGGEEEFLLKRLTL